MRPHKVSDRDINAETKEMWNEIKQSLRERCENYSLRFYGLITPSVIAPLGFGFSDGIGHPIGEQAQRFAVYSAGIGLHFARKVDHFSAGDRFCDGMLLTLA